MAYPEDKGQKNKVLNTGRIAYVGDGTDFYPLRGDSSGRLMSPLRAITTSVDIDLSDAAGVVVAGDVLSNDDCCSTTATYWTFTDVAQENGGYAYITKAELFNEMENLAVQYDLRLLNAIPTGNLKSNFPNTTPLTNQTGYLGKIAFPASTADGATVATTTQATPSTVGNLPMAVKCAAGSRDLYGILVTRTNHTHTTGDTITITLYVE